MKILLTLLFTLFIFTGCGNSYNELDTDYKVVLDTKEDKDNYQLQDVTKLNNKITPILSVEPDGNMIVLGDKSIKAYGHQGANCEDNTFYNARGTNIGIAYCDDIANEYQQINVNHYLNATSWTTSKVSNGKIVLYVPTEDNYNILSYDMNNTTNIELSFTANEHLGRTVQGLFYYNNEYYVLSSNNSLTGLITIYDNNGTIVDAIDVKSSKYTSTKNEVEGLYVDDSGIYVGIIVSTFIGREQLIVKVNR